MHMHGTQLQHFAEITDGGCPWAGTCHIEEDIRLHATKPSVGWRWYDRAGRCGEITEAKEGLFYVYTSLIREDMGTHHRYEQHISCPERIFSIHN